MKSSFQPKGYAAFLIYTLLNRTSGENDMMAYLTMMCNRLLELRRVLKTTGSIYLHCDPTASHYLKIVLDGIFGAENFRNEIIWRRSHPKGLAFTRFASNHDTILVYAKKLVEATWNPMYRKQDADKSESQYSLRDVDGRAYQLTSLLNPNPDRPNLTYEFKGITKVWRWTKERMLEADAKGMIVVPRAGKGIPRYKRYLDEQEGVPIDDVWTDIEIALGSEKLGYPTQKPIALLERIITASSNPGGVVLDPFCGCGTAVHAAEKSGRQWIGIDITHLAISLVEKRLRDAFVGITFEVHGTPKDIDGARDLAQRDKYQFQWWACSLVNAQPWQAKKKGADSGIDGVIYFQDDDKNIGKIIVSVKGGENVSVPMVRDLAHVVDREKAQIGIFVTLAEPTKPMQQEATKFGYYESPLTKKNFPKLQILTVQGLLENKQQALYPDLGRGGITFKKAKVEDSTKQDDLF